MNIKYIIIVLILNLLVSCNEIFEKDIEQKEVILLTPREGYVTEDPIIDFWWEYVDGASWYNLQVATPSFYSDEIEKLVLDTVISSNTFQYLLYPDDFEWRVSAYNNISATDFFYGSFKVDSTPNLHDVILISPFQNFATNDSTVNFKWDGQDNADSYRFELLKDDELIFTDLIEETTILIPDNSVITFLEEGNYKWKVQAQSSSVSPSQFSSRTFTIDRVKPEIPTLLTPSHGDELSETPIELAWDRPIKSGSVLFDSLWISLDSVFSDDNIVLKLFQQDTTYNFTPDNSNLYWWKVKSIDKAGNKGEWSQRKFIYSEK